MLFRSSNIKNETLSKIAFGLSAADFESPSAEPNFIHTLDFYLWFAMIGIRIGWVAELP